MSDNYTAYIETPAGIWRERNGLMEGPFSREDLGLDSQFVPGCQTLRCAFSEGASISFGFGYGAKTDNSFSDR